MELGFDKKVFLVTGGSRGIGKEIVLELLKEGACVSTCSRHFKDLKMLSEFLPDEYRDRFIFCECDIRDAHSIEKVAKMCVEKWGTVDGLVINAGYGIRGGVNELEKEDWMEQCELKLLGAINAINATRKYLKESSLGRIVVINGVTAITPDENMAAVSAARAALRQVIRMYAKELIKDEICVNAVNIGVIDTDRQRNKYEHSKTELSYEEWKRQEATVRKIPMKRFGEVHEVAPMVLFLLSSLASYITGGEIDIAGGMNV